MSNEIWQTLLCLGPQALIFCGGGCAEDTAATEAETAPETAAVPFVPLESPPTIDSLSPSGPGILPKDMDRVSDTKGQEFDDTHAIAFSWRAQDPWNEWGKTWKCKMWVTERTAFGTYPLVAEKTEQTTAKTDEADFSVQLSAGLFKPRRDYCWSVACQNMAQPEVSKGEQACFTTSEQGLLAWLRFDEGEGATIHDSSRPESPLVGEAMIPADCNSWGWVDGVRGKAFNFGIANCFNKGDPSCVSFGTTPELSFGAGPFTISAWIYANWISTKYSAALFRHQYHREVRKGESGSPCGYSPYDPYALCGYEYSGYAIYLTDGGKIGFYGPGFEASGSYESDEKVIVTPKTVTKEIWHHVVITRSWEEAKLSIYLDGKKQVSKHCDEDLTPDSSAGMEISDCGLSVLDLDGYLDEVAFYNRALTDAEILAECQAWAPEGTTCSQ